MGVTYLLDTHAFLWCVGEPFRLPESLKVALAARDARLLVSTASAMEVATKWRLGKLPTASHLVDSAVWNKRVAEMGATSLPLSVEHCLLAGSLAWAHRDPFDRFLAAQAIVEDAILVTKDAAFSQLPGLNHRWG